MISGSWLVMSQGPQPGQTFMLDRDWLTIGRHPSNEIVISDPQVSRQHARITRQGKLMVIEDLGSTNGTFVNGVRLTGPHVMTNGDVISLGEAVTLTYYEVGIATEAETVIGRGVLTPTSPPAYAPHQVAAQRPAAPPAYAAPAAPPLAPPAPPPSYAAVPPAEEEKRKIGLIVGCVAVAVLLVIMTCIGVFVLHHLRLLPLVFYDLLRGLGLIP